MSDADLPRVLAPQLSDGARVGLVAWPVVRRGAGAVAEALKALAADGVAHAVIDGLEQADLDALAEAVRDWPLVTAGSGLALSLAGVLGGSAQPPALPAIGGPALLLSGSCSEATNAQVARWEAEGGATLRLDPLALAAGETPEIAARIGDALAGRPMLLAATQPPEKVREAQARLGKDRAAALVEDALADAARIAHGRGARCFVVAGGETSGAVAKALGAERLAVGPSIAPGVPWCATLGSDPIALALKSGNFGAETFFADALRTAP